MTFAMASGHPDYLDIDTPGAFTMDTTAKIPQLVHKANSGASTQLAAVTFWSWVTDNSGSSIDVSAVAIHHAFNDHVVPGEGADPSAKSSPVQRFHPHVVTVSTAGDDQDFCVIGLTSPVWDFRVKGKTVSLNAEGKTMTTADIGNGNVNNITGWINPDGSCTATGLKVSSADGALFTP